MLLGIKRVYEEGSNDEGERILVDRLWPRGIRKGAKNFDVWMKDVSPSNELRKWFAHDPSKWKEFRKRYKHELMQSGKLYELIALAKKKDITLVYAAKDTEHNNAVALAGLIKEML